MSNTYSNNIVTENGEAFIPASQRPDGTWRKARRVKDGYVPQEEVPLYESKGKQLTKKPEPVILSTGETAKRPIPGLFIVEEKEKKQSKKKNKANKAVDEVIKQLENTKINDKSKSDKNQDSVTDPVKKLKNLKKRLREVEALEEKLKQGLIAKPEPEQLAKIQRKNELVVQIYELEKEI